MLENNPKNSSRIEYIDALRGFTMLLVVFQHVAFYCWHIIQAGLPSVHPYFMQFRMPLFFFISGFVLYKANVVWNVAYVKGFLGKKFMVQIIPTFVFLLLYCRYREINFTAALFDFQKAGYWFTYTLFEYFIFYSVLNIISIIIPTPIRKSFIEVIIVFVIALVFYFICWPPLYDNIPLPNSWKGLLGIPQWSYFGFFLAGTIVRKHYTMFQQCLDAHWLITIALMSYFGINFYWSAIPDALKPPLDFLRSYFGIIILFAFFRTNQAHISKETILGRSLQYVGRRTLDIYLLHYFLLPLNLGVAFPVFTKNPMSVLEAICSFIIAAIIVALCLLISNVIRLSPTLAHWLFGVKKVSR